MLVKSVCGLFQCDKRSGSWRSVFRCCLLTLLLFPARHTAAQSAAKFETEPGMNTDYTAVETSASNNQGNASEYNNEN
jgi:hypothetical protein